MKILFSHRFVGAVFQLLRVFTFEGGEVVLSIERGDYRMAQFLLNELAGTVSHVASMLRIRAARGST